MPTKQVAMPKEVRAAYRAYNTVVGELVWASNYSLGAFEILFLLVSNCTTFKIGRAIWYTAASDGGKFEMLAAATKAADAIPTAISKELLWAVARCRKLAELRNDAIHAATIVTRANPVAITPSEIGTKPTRYSTLKNEANLKKRHRLVKDDLWRLGKYAYDISQHLGGFDEPPPLPERPLLASLQENDHK